MEISRTAATYILQVLTRIVREAWGHDYDPAEPSLVPPPRIRPSIIGELSESTASNSSIEWVGNVVFFVRFLAGIFAHALQEEGDVRAIDQLDTIAEDID
jgi:hypothetical protein